MGTDSVTMGTEGEEEKGPPLRSSEKEEIGGAVTEYPSVNGGIFDWSQLDEGDEICGVFEINAVDSKVKIAIDSAAAESVCPIDNPVP